MRERKNMKDVVIVSACRTAIGAFGGSLRDLNASTLASVTMREAVKRAGIDPALIDDVRYGCCMEPEESLNVARVRRAAGGHTGYGSSCHRKPGLHLRYGGGSFRNRNDHGRYV